MLDAFVWTALKGSPDQPRVPSGQHGGGRWSSAYGSINFDALTTGMSSTLAKNVTTMGETLMKQSFETGEPHETLAFFDTETGEVLDGGKFYVGDRTGVDLDSDAMYELGHRKSGTVLSMHTHPSGTPFSPEDFELTVAQRGAGAIVLGRGGNSYELKLKQSFGTYDKPLVQIRHEISAGFNDARLKTLLETDDWLKEHFPEESAAVEGVFGRMEVAARHPEVEKIHSAMWREALEKMWQKVADDHKDVMTFRVIRSKS